MGKNITGDGSLGYLGVQSPTPPNLTYELRDPVAADNGGYVIGHIWVTKNPIAIFMLTSKGTNLAGYTAIWTKLYPVVGAGTVTSVNAGTNINMTFLTNPAVDPVVNLNPNVNLAGSLTAGTGVFVTTGGVWVTAGGLTVNGGGLYTVDQNQLTDLTNGVVLSDATGVLSSSQAIMAGQVLMSAAPGNPPTWQPSPGGGTVLDVTGDANITIAGTPASHPQVTLNPSVTITGTLQAARLIATTNGLTVTLGGITSTGITTLNSLNHLGVMMTDGTGVVSSMIPGADNEVLTSFAGAISWLPVPGVTYPISIAHGGTNNDQTISPMTQWGVNYYNGTRIVTTTAGAAGQVLKSQGGAGLPPIWDTAGGTGTVTNLVAGFNIRIDGATPLINPRVNVTDDVTLSAGSLRALNVTADNALTVTIGPTTLSYLNHFGILQTNATGVVTSSVPGIAGTVLTSAGPLAAPVWSAVGAGTVTAVSATLPILSSMASPTPVISLSNSVNGQILIGKTATPSSPVWANITAGNGILITNGSGSIQIDSRANFPCDTGTATPNATGVLNVIGGAAIKTTGSGNTITINDTLTINAQVASYILALTDAGKFITMTVAGANTVTIPLAPGVPWVIGTQIVIQQLGAGQTSIVAAGGVTIRSAGGRLKLTEQYSMVALVYIALNTWSLGGDITT